MQTLGKEMEKETSQIAYERSLPDLFEEFISSRYQGVELCTWHQATLESFGLHPAKLRFDNKNRRDHFGKHMGDVPVDSVEKYKKWIEVCYNKFFTPNLDLVIVPNMIYPNRLALYDLESKQTLVIAFEHFDNESAKFVTFHNQDTHKTYSFLRNSGLVQDPTALTKIDTILDNIERSQQSRHKKESAKLYEAELRAARQKRVKDQM
jgi:hypothetical protein